jgi:hypothetical protein
MAQRRVCFIVIFGCFFSKIERIFEEHSGMKYFLKIGRSGKLTIAYCVVLRRNDSYLFSKIQIKSPPTSQIWACRRAFELVEAVAIVSPIA